MNLLSAIDVAIEWNEEAIDQIEAGDLKFDSGKSIMVSNLKVWYSIFRLLSVLPDWSGRDVLDIAVGILKVELMRHETSSS